MKIIFLDTETTGFGLDAEIIEYAFAEWDSEKESRITRGIDSLRVLPKHGCPAEAQAVNGYDEAAWLADGAKHWGVEDVQNVTDYLKPWCNIGGSNPGFDIRMLKQAFSRSGHMTYWNEPNFRYLDTAALGFPLWAAGVVEGVGLDKLATFFGIEHKAHTAAGDVAASIEVWEKFYDLYCHGPAKMRSALVGIAENYPEDPELVKFCRQAIEVEP